MRRLRRPGLTGRNAIPRSVVGAAEGGEAGDEGGKMFEFCGRRGVGMKGQVRDGVGETGGEEAAGAVGHVMTDFIQLPDGTGGAGGAIENVVAGLPLGEAAVTPLGKILVVDGLSVEESSEDFFDRREVIEPREKNASWSGALEKAVHLFAKVMGESCDLAGS